MSKEFAQNKFIERLVQRITEKFREEAEKFAKGYTTIDELTEEIESEGYYFVKYLKETKQRRN